MAYLVQTGFLSHGYELFDVSLAQSSNAKSSILRRGVVKGSPRISREKRDECSREEYERFHNIQAAQKRVKLPDKRKIACDHRC